MEYYVHWTDEEFEVRPNLVGSPKLVVARSPEEAWEKFYALYPRLRDGDGDYYVTIRTSHVPKEDESDVVAEAGVNLRTGQPWFQKR